ncbi:hypothetical protein ACFQ3Z_35860 [Streptomyces nogalater]
MITGNLANVLGTDVWVNSENTRMEMSRVDEPTLSATIRYHGGRRDTAGHLVHDTIALELAEHMAGRSHVTAGSVLVTGPGQLQESHQVRRVLHVAAVEENPAPGTGRSSTWSGACATSSPRWTGWPPPGSRCARWCCRSSGPAAATATSARPSTPCWPPP